ncbi:hypothetical protein [Streptomyces sp. NPDC051132]|uniref:hypothetical protein n=1 Tax=unclassified Streptomyces TaxID=2593676 RepID=UPI00341B9420
MSVDRVADLAGLRPAAAPHRDVQAAHGPYFVGKVHDVVGLYSGPPERASVF